MIVVKILYVIGIIGIVAIWIRMGYMLICPPKVKEDIKKDNGEYDDFKRYKSMHFNIDVVLDRKIQALTLNEIIEGIEEYIESSKEQSIILEELKGHIGSGLDIGISEFSKFSIPVELLSSLYHDSFKLNYRLLECKHVLENMAQDNLKKVDNDICS